MEHVTSCVLLLLHITWHMGCYIINYQPIILSTITSMQSSVICKGNSLANQSLYKPIQNRSRTNPYEIYQKLQNQINSVEHQVNVFNKKESSNHQLLNREFKRFGKITNCQLKSMTQPKIQQFLKGHQFNEEPKEKGKGLRKGISKNMNYSKDFKGQSLGNSIRSSKTFSFIEQRIASTRSARLSKQMGSFAKSINPEAVFQPHSQPLRRGNFMLSNPSQANMSLTESILLPMTQIAEQNEFSATAYSKPLKTAPDLKQLLHQKQAILLHEWEKTEKYHHKIMECIGENEREKVERNKTQYNKVYQLIDKVKCSRVHAVREGEFREEAFGEVGRVKTTNDCSVVIQNL